MYCIYKCLQMLNHITHREIKQDINHIIGKWDKCPVKIITVPLLTLQHDITQKYIRVSRYKYQFYTIAIKMGQKFLRFKYPATKWILMIAKDGWRMFLNTWQLDDISKRNSKKTCNCKKRGTSHAIENWCAEIWMESLVYPFKYSSTIHTHLCILTIQTSTNLSKLFWRKNTNSKPQTFALIFSFFMQIATCNSKPQFWSFEAWWNSSPMLCL